MKTKVLSLILDFNLYPRANLDTTNVGYLVEALASGATLPPVIVDKKSRRVTDGFHRCKAHLKFFGDDAEIEIVEREYKSDKDAFIDAVRMNAHHGVQLNRHDRIHCGIRARELGASKSVLAEVLNMQLKKYSELLDERTAYVGKAAEPVALKSAVSTVLSGKTITRTQADAITKVGGNHLGYYINQVLLFIENDFVDTSNERLMASIEKLQQKLSEFLAAQK